MGEMLEACYEEDRPEFARFVEHFGRGRSDKGIEDVILQAWQFSESHPWPGEWLDSCIRELDEENLGQMGKKRLVSVPYRGYIMSDEGVSRTAGDSS